MSPLPAIQATRAAQSSPSQQFGSWCFSRICLAASKSRARIAVLSCLKLRHLTRQIRRPQPAESQSPETPKSPQHLACPSGYDVLRLAMPLVPSSSPSCLIGVTIRGHIDNSSWLELQRGVSRSAEKSFTAWLNTAWTSLGWPNWCQDLPAATSAIRKEGKPVCSCTNFPR